MISILIACYNQDILTLISSIHAQGEALNIEFEIIAHDNGLDDEIQTTMQKQLEPLTHFHYYCRQSDSTRSASRNWMASKAKYPYLLFIDGDSAVVDDEFLRRYVSLLPTESIWVGGTAYRKDPPPTESKLRWIYGVAREMTSARDRKTLSSYGFSSFNFMIPKAVFDTIGFDEKIQAYGHEDTLLGQELIGTGHSIDHVDNPLYHEGLDENAVFLKKSAIGIQTMVELYQQGKLKEDTRLISTYRKLKGSGLLFLFKIFLNLSEGRLEKNLLGDNPKLKYFDIWKLGKLSKLM